MAALAVCSLLVLIAGAQAKLARPTADQLQWSREEMGAIIHFNIATFVPEFDGCNVDSSPEVPNAKLFNPVDLNIQQWADTLKAYGAKHAVMVVKHACGFALWPTKVSFPEFNFTYDYNIANSKFTQTKDIARDFVDTMRRNGIRPGFYYTTTDNLYLNIKHSNVMNSTLKPGQVRLTQDQTYQVALAQLEELWTQYGELSEIWFDGGYPPSIHDRISKMLMAYQPNAVVFGGGTLTPNGIRWIGTESGKPKAPVWSAVDSISNNPDPKGSLWYPPECDTTLQQQDRWFYKQGIGLRSFQEMLQVYHDSVGDNCNLLLDLTPDQTGVVPKEYVAAYTRFGNFIRQCYAKPVAQTYGTGKVIEAHMEPYTRVDRIVLQEDIEQGQRIQSYTIDMLLPEIGWEPVTTGKSIGQKRILVLDAAVSTSVLRLTVLETVNNTEAIVQKFAAYDCSSMY